MQRQALHCIVAAVASLQEGMNSYSASDTLYVKTFHKQIEPVLHFSLSTLYVTSLSLLYSFCDEKYITRQAAQEILFRSVIAQKIERAGRKRERERGLFLTEAISQRSCLTRLRNMWVWLRVKRHRMK